jgi:dolichol-phosphate mannosyltransferase
MSLSVIIPVKNEENVIVSTLQNLLKTLEKNLDDTFEVIIVDDFSTDNTVSVINSINSSHIKCISNKFPGVGRALSLAIESCSKNYVCIFMADESDDVSDLIKYYNLIRKKSLDAVFGSRFIKNSKITNYPLFKLILNRIFNFFVSLFFCYSYNDYTNAFKIYKRETLLKLFPLISEKFNIFLEIPLKIISRKYTFEIIPIIWKSRKIGFSKFYIKELRSHYLFTFFYCLLEKILIKK